MSSDATKRMDSAAWAMLLLLSTLWGLSFVLVEVALTALPVFTLVALRVAIAAATLWVLVAVRRIPIPSDWRVWRAFLVMGVFNNAVPFALIVSGQTVTTAGLAAVLNATTPLFTALLAGLFLPDERLTPARLLGVVMGTAGVAAMIGPQALSGLGRGEIGGQLAVLGAALSYAGSAVFARRFAGLGVRPVVIALGQTTASTLVLAPLALVLEGPFALAPPGPGVWAAVIAMGCFATAFAYILYFNVLARAGASNVVLVTVLVPVVAVVAGAMALGEAVRPGQLAGMALIGAGLAVVDGRWPRRLLPPR